MRQVRLSLNGTREQYVRMGHRIGGHLPGRGAWVARRLSRRALLIALLAAAALLVALSVSAGRGANLVGAAAALPLCGRNGTTTGPVPAWRMGAVKFVSPTEGVGVTATTLICFSHSKTGTQVSYRAQPAVLAESTNDGRSWRLTGTAAPTGRTPQATSGEQLVTASRSRVWVVGADGRLLATTDSGRSWRHVTIPGPTAKLAKSDDHVWAVTCLHIRSRAWPFACRLHLWRAPIGTGAWRQVRLPKLTAQDPDVNLATASDQNIVLDLLNTGHRATGELAISTNGGSSWRTRPDPSWDGHPCTGTGELTATPPTTFWLLCLGAAAAGSSTKALLESTNSGSTWDIVSAVTSLTQTPSPRSIPLSEPSALAAGSIQRVWLATTNGLAESNDGGKSWNNVPGAFDPGGWPTVISVLDATHAWLLAPGAGLWSTTDGEHWKPTGPLHTS